MSSNLRQAIERGDPHLEVSLGSVRFEFVRIAPGDFLMGSAEKEPGHHPAEAPLRRIAISKAFLLGRFEVTQSQYEAVMKANPSRSEGGDLPVDQLSYSDARRFCRKMSEALDVKVTLPTSAQWEYACRAGTATRYNTGNSEEDLAAAGWYRGNADDRIHPVGQKQPNAWGLYDMHGNVWEACLDILPPYQSIASSDPVGQVSETKGTMRGGGWMHDAEDARSASFMKSNDRFGGMGVRIAINSEGH